MLLLIITTFKKYIYNGDTWKKDDAFESDYTTFKSSYNRSSRLHLVVQTSKSKKQISKRKDNNK